MAQQTAVDYLVNELRLNLTIYKHTKNVINKAKAMEKEQIMKAVYDGMGTNFDPNMGRAEQYYNETYTQGN